MLQSFGPTEDPKQLILRAAVELGRELGFEKTSIRGICRRAGISIGAFYHYYKSKEELVNDAFLHFDSTLDEETVARYNAMPAAHALVAVMLDQTRFTSQQGYQLVTEYYRALLQNANRGAVSPERGYYREVLSCVRRAQQEGVFPTGEDAAETAEMLLRFVRGNLVDWCLHDGAYDVCAVTERELEWLVASLRAKA